MSTLSVKFLVNDYKEENPLSVVVHKKRACQMVLSVFLHKCYAGVEIHS